MRVLGIEIIEKAGLAAKHALGVLLLCWRRMARAGLVSGVAGFILVETVSSLLQQKFPGLDLSTVVAMVFALVVAYAVALTVFIDELFIGAIDLLKTLEGDVGAGARAIAIAGERRVGEAGSGIMRWLGVRPYRPHGETVVMSPALEGLVFADIDTPYSAEDQLKQTQADIEATDEFLSTAPRPRVNARPVQAGQLPRISWAMDKLEQEDEAPPLPVPPPPEGPLATAPRATAPRVTRPITRPLPIQEDQAHLDPPRGVWSRISKTLVGNVHPPVDDGEEAAAVEALGSEET
jgi:hypothetical protein